MYTKCAFYDYKHFIEILDDKFSMHLPFKTMITFIKTNTQKNILLQNVKGVLVSILKIEQGFMDIQ